MPIPECDRVPILELLRGELPAFRCEEVLAHLRGCPRCRERAKLMGLLELEPPEIADRPAPLSVGPGPRRHLRYLLPAAAAVLLVAGLLLVWSPQLRRAGAPAGAPALEPYPWDLALTRDTPEPTGRELLQEAAELYRRGEYATAAARLLQLPPAPATDFYLALCWLFSGRNTAAARLLEDVAGGGTAWAEPARWYLAHAYYRQSNLAGCLRELKTLADRSGPHQEAARKWLLQLQHRAGGTEPPDREGQ